MIPHRSSNLVRWLLDFGPLIFWMGLIFWLSSQSVLVKIDSRAGEKLFFKSAHIMAYAALAWLWWRALARDRSASWPVLGWAFLLTALYGVSDEIHQLFVPGRHGLLTDVLLDAAGAALMVLLIRRLKWLRTFPEEFLFSSS